MNETSQTNVVCAICNEKLDLQMDRNANENGKAVHQECYLGQITKVGYSEASGK